LQVFKIQEKSTTTISCDIYLGSTVPFPNGQYSL
jgi:hypothetical protein